MPGVTVRLSERLATKKWPVMVEVSRLDARSGELNEVVGHWLAKQGEYPHGGVAARVLPSLGENERVRLELDFSDTTGGGDAATFLPMLLYNEFEKCEARAKPEIDLVE